MNRRIAPAPEPAGAITFEYNGEPVRAQPGDTLASALLAAGVDIFSRSIKYHRARGPYCLSGRCSHCLVRVDGVPDVMACTTPAEEGLHVAAQNAYPSAKHDVLAAIDWMFPKGLDHHSMFAGVPLFEGAMAKVARHIAGLGPLPDRVHAPSGRCERRYVRAAVVGAGPAGLACARALAGSRLSVELYDDKPFVGGRLLSGLEADAEAELAWAAKTRAECEEAGVRVRSRAVVLATYVEEGRPVLAVRLPDPDRLELVKADHVVYCTGAVEPLEAFANNELPGIFAGRGLARLVRLQKVLPGRRAVVFGSGPEALALARLLDAAGARLEALVDPAGRLDSGAMPSGVRLLKGFAPAGAHGHSRVQALAVKDASGAEEVLDCDLVALCPAPAPAFELARQAGAAVAYRAEDGGYAVEADAQGRTRAEGIYAAGDITGATSAARAREAGEALGRALAAAAAAQAS